MSKEKEELDAWLKQATEGSLPKMKESSVYAGIVTDSFLKEPLCALQLGYAILLDKPIILIADKTMKLPESLVKVAKVIERVDIKNPADMKRASESIGSFARGLG